MKNHPHSKNFLQFPFPPKNSPSGQFPPNASCLSQSLGWLLKIQDVQIIGCYALGVSFGEGVVVIVDSII